VKVCASLESCRPPHPLRCCWSMGTRKQCSRRADIFLGALCLSSGSQAVCIPRTTPQRSTPRTAFCGRSGCLKHLVALQAGSLEARECCQRHGEIVARMRAASDLLPAARFSVAQPSAFRNRPAMSWGGPCAAQTLEHHAGPSLTDREEGFFWERHASGRSRHSNQGGSARLTSSPEVIPGHHPRVEKLP
jgi:hypothetical protein